MSREKVCVEIIKKGGIGMDQSSRAKQRSNRHGSIGRAITRIIGKAGFGRYRPNRNRLIYIRLLSHVQQEALGR